MGTVVADMSMSVDGFVAGPDTDSSNPLGVGGELLHRWLFADPQDPRDVAVSAEVSASVGAVVLGRRTFDVGVDIWGDVPFPAPCFVLTHRPHADLAMTGGSFTFVTGGLAQAVSLARAAAGAKNVQLMGAETVRQAITLGLLEELQINLVPVLLGRGVRMFDELPADHVDLVRARVIASDAVTHLRYRLAGAPPETTSSDAVHDTSAGRATIDEVPRPGTRSGTAARQRREVTHHEKRTMKNALLILAALLVVFGTVFFFQGIGVLGGGAMVGDPKWAVIGPVLAVIGVLLGIWVVRRGRTSH